MRKKRSTFARKGRHGPTLERRESWVAHRRLRLDEARERWRTDPRRKLTLGEELAYEAACQKRERKLSRPGYLGAR